MLQTGRLHLMGQVQVDRTGKIPEARLSIDSGDRNRYRIAQVDDYFFRSRHNFVYTPPLSIALEARVSANELPGTWGFGFWNDPFAFGIGIKGSGWRLPALPQAVWFFYGSSANNLSVNSQKSACGLMASVFSSRAIPSLMLVPALPATLVLPIKPVARLIRRLAARIIHDEFHSLDIDTDSWHSYRMEWLPSGVNFIIDGSPVFSSSLSPKPPLGLVIWIDNQFAAFHADGCVSWGLEANRETAWMEIRNIQISRFK